MTKIDQIKHAISEANFFRSKLSPEALAVPGFTSLKIRHLMNNLGAISTNYIDFGSHKGSTACSVAFNNDNLEHITCIDSFVEFTEGSPMQELLNNMGKFKPGNVGFTLLMKDGFTVGPESIPSGVDLYLYDAEHSLEAQRKGVSHFLESMADEFILVVDDYSAFEGVKEGTQFGIADSGCEVLFEQELYNGIAGDNMGWHNGIGLFLLKKV